MTEQNLSVPAVNAGDPDKTDESTITVSVSNESDKSEVDCGDDKITNGANGTQGIVKTTADNDKSAAADDDAQKGDNLGEKKKEKRKPRVLKEKIQGIYTITEIEAANFFFEWYKGLRASAPYIVRLTKTYWTLSPSYSSALATVSLLKVALPSFQLWLRKEFLDQVQRAAEGKGVLLEKLLVLMVLRLCEQAMKQGLELATYFLYFCLQLTS